MRTVNGTSVIHIPVCASVAQNYFMEHCQDAARMEEISMI